MTGLTGRRRPAPRRWVPRARDEAKQPLVDELYVVDPTPPEWASVYGLVVRSPRRKGVSS